MCVQYNVHSLCPAVNGEMCIRDRLGTATPGVETYFNATSGKYGLVELKERYKDIRLPHIELVDIKELAHQKRCLLYTSRCV